MSAFDEAVRGAAENRYGAGDIVWSRSEDDLRCAIVLEPDVIFERAIEMGLLAMVALGDALGAIGPPVLAIAYRWPFDILANGGHVGRISIALPGDARAGSVPSYLVVGIELAVRRQGADTEPGEDAARTTLHEEGGGELDRTLMIESLARHFLSWVDSWQADGFEPVRQLWLFRAADRNRAARVSLGGIERRGHLVGLDEHGGLLLETANGIETVTLVDAVLDAARARP